MKLHEIQKQLKAPKNQYNSFGKYKYRNCEDILEAVKPLLGTSTLIITDEIKEIQNIPFVEATCIFNDGEKEIIVKAQAGIDPNRKGMDIAQCFGASSSYARKYALNGLFLIDDNKDPDTQPPVKPKITDEQVNKAIIRIKGGEVELIDKLKNTYELSTNQIKLLNDASNNSN